MRSALDRRQDTLLTVLTARLLRRGGHCSWSHGLLPFGSMFSESVSVPHLTTPRHSSPRHINTNMRFRSTLRRLDLLNNPNYSCSGQLHLCSVGDTRAHKLPVGRVQPCAERGAWTNYSQAVSLAFPPLSMLSASPSSSHPQPPNEHAHLSFLLCNGVTPAGFSTMSYMQA
jgi:hypothetical protein